MKKSFGCSENEILPIVTKIEAHYMNEKKCGMKQNVRFENLLESKLHSRKKSVNSRRRSICVDASSSNNVSVKRYTSMYVKNSKKSSSGFVCHACRSPFPIGDKGQAKYYRHPHRSQEMLCQMCSTLSSCSCCETRVGTMKKRGRYVLCRSCQDLGGINMSLSEEIKKIVLNFLSTFISSKFQRVCQSIRVLPVSYITKEMMNAQMMNSPHLNELRIYGNCVCTTNGLMCRKIERIEVVNFLPGHLYAAFLAHEYVHALLHLTKEEFRRHEICIEEAVCNAVMLTLLVQMRKSLDSKLKNINSEHNVHRTKALMNLIDFWIMKLRGNVNSEYGTLLKNILLTVKSYGWGAILSRKQFSKHISLQYKC